MSIPSASKKRGSSAKAKAAAAARKYEQALSDHYFDNALPYKMVRDAFRAGVAWKEKNR